MERTEYAPGTPSWVDLGTPDIDAAAVFYGSLFGWEATEPGPVEESGGYRMFMIGDKTVAGLGPQQNPGPPYWTTYVTVADADETAAVAEKAGATVFLEPMDVLDAGRMAVFADPTGAAVSIWQAKLHIGAQLVNEPNTLCWNELATRDPAAAKAFYTTVFGWQAQEEGGGAYTEWQLDGQSIGGMLPMPDGVPDEVPNHWLAYFAVEDADATVAKATSLGATLLREPMDIPQGRFAMLTDPQGAVFAVIGLQGVQ